MRFPSPRLVGYAAMATTVPYLALKVAWIAGVPVGVSDPALMRQPAMLAANIITAGLELVAMAIALAFARDWGRRLPAWLLLPPMWVGTGLLTPIAVSMPIIAGYALLTGVPVFGGRGLAPWVFAVVYGGFTAEASLLFTAFAGHARRRWGPLLRARVAAVPAGATAAAQRPLTVGTALLAGVTAAVHLYWALGGTVALSAAAPRGFPGRLIDSVHAVAALAGAAGLLVLVLRWRPAAATWRPLTAAWVGAAVTFSWGLWSLPASLTGSGPGGPALVVLGFGKILTGVLLGVVGTVVLAERSAAADRVGA
ncbi:hypothetical protein [Couchioplanes azureus]|uniref:hypothetical protein n=1 Tax=Couchioplanes caeruleus TaxID=56438 RepID=UPI0016707916|nr:hypothetical protein [Couchioplanes caeruleus]GGQ71293.1 hypothetical protein GCM10010166_46790 [Couchioplanes caeruleus subsp. azureus]